MYELIILTLLINRPAHGYLIAKIINDIIGPYAKISNGRLYPLLNTMVNDGLIEPFEAFEGDAHTGNRPLKSFKITDAGCKRFHELIMDTSSNLGEYQKLFLQKAWALGLLEPPERLRLLEHYIHYCQTHILHLTSEMEDFREQSYWENADQKEAILDTMQHRIDQWQLELDWANHLKAKTKPV